MPEGPGPSPQGLERDATLVVAGVYEREVAARVEDVWENVFDWEHLPWLHAQAFASIDPRATGDWGWCAEVGFPGGARAEIELVADRAAGRYVARTLSGAGAPGEIWTTLVEQGPGTTAVRVEFAVAPGPADALERIGRGAVALYAALWDQDEGMIRRRAAARAARARERTRSEPEEIVVELGDWSALRRRLPVVVDVGGDRFRIVEQGGGPVAHSVECPHWLGPLDACPVEAGIVTCPWHGYRFDVATGRSVDGRGLRLRPAPPVEVDPASGRVRLVRA